MQDDPTLPDPAPEDGIAEMHAIARRISPALQEFCQCWQVLAVRAGTNQVMMFGEGANIDGNREKLDEAILLTAAAIIRDRVAARGEAGRN